MLVFSVASGFQKFLLHLVEEFHLEDHLDMLSMRYLSVLIGINNLAVKKKVDNLTELVRVMLCKIYDVES